MRVRLIHWNESEADQGVQILKKAGHTAVFDPFSPGLLKEPAAHPDLFVIDLNRLPSHGREVALSLRMKKSTRSIPIVFVGGPAEKVEALKRILPDATYSEWTRIRSAMKAAIRNQPDSPVVPSSVLAGYSGTPLPKKLGIKANSSVGLVDPPENVNEILSELPDGVTVTAQPRSQKDLVLWFVRSRKMLQRKLSRAARLFGAAGLWIIWPKKTSGLESDLNQAIVRQVGLDFGLVDYKVAAIDAVWSGLRFTYRK